MRNKKLIRDKVRNLRSQGKTYNEIIRSLDVAVAKSTISYWTRNIALPNWYKDKIRALNEKSFSKAQKAAWVKNRKNRELIIKNAQIKADNLLKKSSPDFYLLALAIDLFLNNFSLGNYQKFK